MSDILPLSRCAPCGRQVELPFHKIMDYLDNSSLLAMGKVNHKLNRAALARILGPSIIEGIFMRAELIIGRRQPIELLAALCAARWLPSRIKSIGYFAARDDIHDFVRDMLGLALLLSRLSQGSLETLRLEISVNTTASSMYKCEKEHRWPVTNLTWARALSNVVDAALFVGCSTISIVTDYLPEFSRIEPSPPPSRPTSPSRTDIISLLQTFMMTVSHNVLPPDDSLRVKSLTFATAHFLTDTLFNYTLCLFGRVSSTLQDLVFSSSPDYCYSSSTWATLFQAIRLPALKSLTFSFPKGASILPRDLFNFLSNHPTIISLKLDLCFAGFSIDSSLPTFEDPLGGSILPNLRVLEAWPQFVPWLFPRGRKPSFTQRLVRTTTRPRLSTVRILTTDFSLKANPGMLLNHVILALNPFTSCPSTTHPQNLSLGPSLALQMNFHDIYWYEWIWTNVTAPADSTNPLLTISKISKLTLEIDSSVEASSKTRMDIPLIAEWLALFPLLLELEIVGNPFTEDALNEELCDAIALRCPNLRRLSCEGVIVSL